MGFFLHFSKVPNYSGSILRLKILFKMNRIFSRLNTVLKSLELKFTTEMDTSLIHLKKYLYLRIYTD